MWWRVSQEIWNWKSFKLNKFALNWINLLTFVPFTNGSIKSSNNRKVEFRLCSFSEMLFFIILCTVISTVDFIHLKKEFECTFCKAIFQFFISRFFRCLYAFSFQTFNKYISICLFTTFYCLKMVLKLEIIEIY